MNNYAATLLIMRRNPEEAVRLTLQLLAQNPASPVARVNHAAALLLNERVAEAENLLRSVPTNALNRAQISLYNLDLFEMKVRLGHLENAKALLDLIEERYLYPPQREWLTKLRKQLLADDDKG
jgi:hypothetical protein